MQGFHRLFGTFLAGIFDVTTVFVWQQIQIDEISKATEGLLQDADGERLGNAHDEASLGDFGVRVGHRLWGRQGHTTERSVPIGNFTS